MLISTAPCAGGFNVQRSSLSIVLIMIMVMVVVVVVMVISIWQHRKLNYIWLYCYKEFGRFEFIELIGFLSEFALITYPLLISPSYLVVVTVENQIALQAKVNVTRFWPGIQENRIYRIYGFLVCFLWVCLNCVYPLLISPTHPPSPIEIGILRRRVLSFHFKTLSLSSIV